MASQGKFRLRISGTDNPVDLSPGVTTIGRQTENRIVLAHKLVSRQHATIDVTDSGCLLKDLESANGTFLNGTRLASQKQVPVQIGDKIRIGEFELSLERQEARQPTRQSKPEAVTTKFPREDAFARKRAGMIPPPPPVPPVGIPVKTHPLLPDPGQPPPGLSHQSRVLINYLPDIYQDETDGFLSRYLAIFEAILFPIQWQIDNFDLFLDSATVPTAFLPWLESWFRISLEPGWSEESRRSFLKEASRIYARLGTRWSLSRTLEIYSGVPPTIRELEEPAFSFTVELPFVRGKFPHEIIEQLINMNKPAFTTYEVVYKE